MTKRKSHKRGLIDTLTDLSESLPLKVDNLAGHLFSLSLLHRGEIPADVRVDVCVRRLEEAKKTIDRTARMANEEVTKRADEFREISSAIDAGTFDSSKFAQNQVNPGRSGPLPAFAVATRKPTTTNPNLNRGQDMFTTTTEQSIALITSQDIRNSVEEAHGSLYGLIALIERVEAGNVTLPPALSSALFTFVSRLADSVDTQSRKLDTHLCRTAKGGKA